MSIGNEDKIPYLNSMESSVKIELNYREGLKMREINYDQGIYILEMLLPEEIKLEVGKLGTFDLTPGYYYYIGSAQKNLKARVSRHLNEEKATRWHIDYLLEHANILQVYVWPGEKELECILSNYLERFPAALIPIAGFGASDCKCTSHLYYFSYRPNMANLIHSIKEEKRLLGEMVLEVE